jgi:hypothetical protein
MRLRFDDSFESVLDEMKELSYFDDNSSIAIFAASLALDQNLSRPCKRSSKDIRLNVLLGTSGGRELMYLIAVSNQLFASDDPLSEENTLEVLRAFEAHANAGLELLDNLKKSGRTMASVIPEMVAQKFKNMTHGAGK